MADITYDVFENLTVHQLPNFQVLRDFTFVLLFLPSWLRLRGRCDHLFSQIQYCFRE